MLTRRNTDNNKDSYNSKSPLIYYRRLSDKIFIAIFFITSLICIYTGSIDIKENSPPLMIAIALLSVFLGLITSRICISLYNAYLLRR
jgi:hypothetical protein